MNDINTANRNPTSINNSSTDSIKVLKEIVIEAQMMCEINLSYLETHCENNGVNEAGCLCYRRIEKIKRAGNYEYEIEIEVESNHYRVNYYCEDEKEELIYTLATKEDGLDNLLGRRKVGFGQMLSKEIALTLSLLIELQQDRS
jgi:hypothetical protein